VKNSIFEYLDYKKYLSDWIEGRPENGRGERSRIAAGLKCHVAYVSRVLGGNADFSLEQGHVLNGYLAHSPEEADFFLLLLSHGRAGTADLKAYYGSKIRSELAQRSVLKNRLTYQKTVSMEHQMTYFSAWYYSAVHLLLSFKGGQTRESIARELGLTPKKVSEILSFMLEAGLAAQKHGRYETGKVSIHLPNDSPMISKHHVNWKMQAIASLEREGPEELHYSSAVSIAKKDVPRIRAALVAAIESVRGIVQDSPEEEIHCYSLDFFKVGAQAR
jgi:uncharacterized protein (TIGR02147 family)